MPAQKEKKLGELFKSIVTTGIGAAFLTEEALKDKLSELSLSKDYLNNILQSAKGARDEFLKSVKGEVKNYLGGLDVSSEIAKVVENYDIEVSAKFSFSPKKGGKKTTQKK